MGNVPGRQSMEFPQGLGEPRGATGKRTTCDFLQLVSHIHMIAHTSSTAQGRGGSFKNRKPLGEVRLVVVNHGWQSESTDGPKGC